MRGVLVAAVAAVGLLLGSFASAQGLGDVATQEKEKRKAAPKTEGKVYTENDLGPSVAPVGVPSSLPAEGEALSEWIPGNVYFTVPGGDHTFGARHPWAGWTAPLDIVVEQLDAFLPANEG